MSTGAEQRLLVVRQVELGGITLDLAAVSLGLSNRQMRRIWKRYGEEGEKCLVHRGRGRESNRAFPSSVREAVLHEYSSSYKGVGPTLFTKALCDKGYNIDHETVRRWLCDSGLWTSQKLAESPEPREPRSRRFGFCLVHVSLPFPEVSSFGAVANLHFLQDSETGLLLVAFERGGEPLTLMNLLWRWVARYGVPLAVSCRKALLTETAAGNPLLHTCDRLGLETHTLSPARERSLTVKLQGVLLSVSGATPEASLLSLELAEKAIGKLELDPSSLLYLGDSNADEDFHVPIVDGTDLRNVFCFRREYETRQRARQSSRSDTRLLILPSGTAHSPKTRLAFTQWLDGSHHYFANGKEISASNFSLESTP